LLNVYAGPGITELWIDDLEIGPCRPDPKNPGMGARGSLTSRTKTAAHPYAVEFVGGKILIDKKPFFMRAIRHTDTGSEGLLGLREAKFNTVYLAADTDPKVIDEAVMKHQFMVVPGVPLLPSESNISSTGAEVEAERFAEHFRRFRSGDGMLMWDLGTGRQTEDLKKVARTADLLRSYDPRRPRAVDLWDGYQYYSEYMDVIGTHRWPLFTSLQPNKYREWLQERKALTGPGKMLWTWVQTHMPDWYVKLATGQSNPDTLQNPLGPGPEQIRMLTYLGLSAGCRGLGFWSDRYLAQSHLGRDRLIELYFLNCEIELLEPVLFAVEDEKTEWIATNNPYVRAAVLRGRKGIIVLPVWVGEGAQHVMPQASLPDLKIRVEQIPEGADPWLLTPATYTNLRNTGGVRDIPPGVEITIPQFDTTAAIVFTTDTAPDGLVVRWQDNIRHTFGPTASIYAREQAEEQLRKVTQVHQQLIGLAPPVIGADELLKESRQYLRRSQLYAENGQTDAAYREARRALRPLRILMNDHWQLATKTLSVPTSSPYAVSFWTLPQHWELARQMQSARPGPNALPHGDFELTGTLPKEGAAIKSLPNWTVRAATIDPVELKPAIVNFAETKPEVVPPPPPPFVSPGTRVGKFSSARVEAARTPVDSAGPDTPTHSLQLVIQPKKVQKPGQKGPIALPLPGALERTFLSVDSPQVEFPPGTWVRISFWAQVGLVLSADGAMMFDSAGGEPLAVRIESTTDYNVVPAKLRWKQYYVYRQVPASGKIGVSFAINGAGTASFDDVKIEPMFQGQLPQSLGENGNDTVRRTGR
ncbi:MAG: hypothetical protein ACRCZF_02585, partial [Gemmataceae bacterium]